MSAGDKQGVAGFLDDAGRDHVPGSKPRAAKVQPFDRSKWGLFPDLSMVDYLADFAPEPSLSNSGCGILLDETPLDFAYQHPRLNPDPELLTAELEKRLGANADMGTVVHRLALGKGKDYAVAPGNFKDWRTKDAGEFKAAAIKAGKVPLLQHKFAEAEAMAEVVKERIRVTLDDAAYQTEVAFLFQLETKAGPIWCRGMLDVWSEEAATILDVKVSGQLYKKTLGRQMVNMGWDRQAAWYPFGVGQILPELAGRIKFADLLVKDKPPFTSRLARPEKAWTASSLRQCLRAAEIFGECIHAKQWPGFPAMVEDIEMPAWEDKRRELEELS